MSCVGAGVFIFLAERYCPLEQYYVYSFGLSLQGVVRRARKIARGECYSSVMSVSTEQPGSHWTYCIVISRLTKIIRSGITFVSRNLRAISTNVPIITVIPRLTKVIRSGITFVSRNLRAISTNVPIITVIPRLTKVIRSGITFVSRNFSHFQPTCP